MLLCAKLYSGLIGRNRRIYALIQEVHSPSLSTIPCDSNEIELREKHIKYLKLTLNPWGTSLDKINIVKCVPDR